MSRPSQSAANRPPSRHCARSLYEAWQNRNPQISQIHTDSPGPCQPSSLIRENLRNLWIDGVSKVMALPPTPVARPLALGCHRFAANPILFTGCRKSLLPTPSITYGSEPLSPRWWNPSATTEPQRPPECQVVPRHFAKTAGRGADSQVAQIHTSSPGACPPCSFICENLRSM